jgi:hypothetical protein
MCGCGGQTPSAEKTEPEKGYVKGQPVRYIRGHHNRSWRGRRKSRNQKARTSRAALEIGPNPSGLCMCGCGETTSIAGASNPSKGEVRGTRQRYIRGHNVRERSPGQLRRSAAAQGRHALIIDDYRNGLPVAEIARRHGKTVPSTHSTISRLRKVANPPLSYRIARAPAAVLKRLEDEGRVSKKAVAKATPGPLRGTPADIEREAELAALVAEQHHDAEHGDYAGAGTVSLDRPIGDGGSLHDLLRAA